MTGQGIDSTHRYRAIEVPALREWRQRAALSQEELGKLAEVSSGTIAKIESARRRARPSTVRKLARALDVTPQELVRAPRRLG